MARYYGNDNLESLLWLSASAKRSKEGECRSLGPDFVWYFVFLRLENEAVGPTVVGCCSCWTPACEHHSGTDSIRPIHSLNPPDSLTLIKWPLIPPIHSMNRLRSQSSNNRLGRRPTWRIVTRLLVINDLILDTWHRFWSFIKCVGFYETTVEASHSLIESMTNEPQMILGVGRWLGELRWVVFSFVEGNKCRAATAFKKNGRQWRVSMPLPIDNIYLQLSRLIPADVEQTAVGTFDSFTQHTNFRNRNQNKHNKYSVMNIWWGVIDGCRINRQFK